MCAQEGFRVCAYACFVCVCDLSNALAFHGKSQCGHHPDSSAGGYMVITQKLNRHSRRPSETPVEVQQAAGNQQENGGRQFFFFIYKTLVVLNVGTESIC